MWQILKAVDVSVVCVDYRYRMTGLRQISVYKVHRRQSYDCNGWFQSHHTRIFLNRYFHTNPVKYSKKLECNRLVLSLCFPCALWRRQQCKTARVRAWMAIVVVNWKWISRNTTRKWLFRSLFSKYKLLINYNYAQQSPLNFPQTVITRGEQTKYDFALTELTNKYG